MFLPHISVSLQDAECSLPCPVALPWAVFYGHWLLPSLCLSFFEHNSNILLYLWSKAYQVIKYTLWVSLGVRQISIFLSWVTLNKLNSLIIFLACFMICEKQYLLFGYIVRIKKIRHLVLCFSRCRHPTRCRSCFLCLDCSLSFPPPFLHLFYSAILSLDSAMPCFHMPIQPL